MIMLLAYNWKCDRPYLLVLSHALMRLFFTGSRVFCRVHRNDYIGIRGVHAYAFVILFRQWTTVLGGTIPKPVTSILQAQNGVVEPWSASRKGPGVAQVCRYVVVRHKQIALMIEG